MGRINAVALSLALGLIYGILMLKIGLLSMLTGWGKDIFKLYSSFFPGYRPTVSGSIIGAIWGALWGLAFGFAIAVVYNAIAKMLKG